MKLKVFFDYACPFCYIAHADLKALLPDHPDVKVHWCACEAHPRSEPRATSPHLSDWWARLVPVAENAGLAINPPHSPVSHSDIAFQGMYYIMQHGGDVLTYHDRVYQAMFLEGKDIEDIGVLTECAHGLCKDAQGFVDALRSRLFAEVLNAANNRAYAQASVWAVPSYIMDGERLDAIEGIGVTKAQLTEFLAKSLP